MDYRSSSVLLLFLSVCLLHAERATVSADTAAVYSHPRVSEEVLASLARGVPVLVDFTSMSSSGQWCSIREPEKKIKGYMRCIDLDREAIGAFATTLLRLDGDTKASEIDARPEVLAPRPELSESASVRTDGAAPDWHRVNTKLAETELPR